MAGPTSDAQRSMNMPNGIFEGVSMRHARGTIVIAGSIAQKPWHGGHTWVFLQYILGFKKLGWDVLFLDRLEPAMCVDDEGNPCPIEQSVNLRYFQRIMESFELNGAYSLACNGGEYGVPHRQVLS